MWGVPINPITLTSANGASLPDPQYLKLHRTCARVLRLSGADEYIEDVIRREEEVVKVLCGPRVLTDLTQSEFSALYERLQALPKP